MSTAVNTSIATWKDGDLVLTATPTRVAAGTTVVITVLLTDCNDGGEYNVNWVLEGPTRLSDRDTRLVLLGATTVDADTVQLDETNVLQATLDTAPLTVGAWRVGLKLELKDSTASSGEGGEYPRPVLLGVSDPIQIEPKPFTSGDDVAVTMKRTAVPETSDQAFWVAIRNSTNALGFNQYLRFLDAVLCEHNDLATDPGDRQRVRKAERRAALPFPNVDRYRLLKAATEVFLMTHCGVDLKDFSGVNLANESRRLNRTVEPGDLETQMADYLGRVVADDGQYLDVLPYLELIRLQLRDVSIVGAVDGNHDSRRAEICYGIIAEKLTNPCLMELIHEYWYDEASVARAINAVSRRFQNRRTRGGRDALAGLDLDPLRPLSNVLWGLVQDQQHRLTTVRRAYEYDHQYGLQLSSRPTPRVRGADSRSRFAQAFHHLLSLCAVFWENDDNTTVMADGFGVLNALKETHLLLTEGAHNQYGDLGWTARHEMLMYQWILSRAEVSDFLPTRTMVANPEGWIGSLDAMNKLQGWTDVPALHFRDLAVFGEQLLLSIRFGAWTAVHEPEQAANWARYWRPEAQGYIHAYRAVSGVDFSQRAVRTNYSYAPRQRSRNGAYRN